MEDRKKVKETIKLEMQVIETTSSQLNLNRYRGMLLALVSSFAFSLTAMLVKFLKSYHPVTIALWRIQGSFLPSLVLILYKLFKEYRQRKKLLDHGPMEEKSELNKKESILENVYPLTDKKKLKLFLLVLLRSVLTCNALLLHFYSLKYLEMADALVISSSAPVFVTLFAWIFLNEGCGLVPVFSALMTVIGVIVIAKPPHIFGHEDLDEKTMVGIGLSLGCMLVATVSYLILRYIRKVHHVVTNFMFGSWGTFENAILAIILGVLNWPNCYKDWLAAFALASLTFVGQMSIILAMKCEQAGPVSLVRTCDVIFGFFFQICILDCWPEIYSWIGCSIVMFSLAVTALRKWVESLDQEDSTRKRLFFLLL